MKFTPIMLLVALCMVACGQQAVPSKATAQSPTPEITEAQAISVATAELARRSPNAKFRSFSASKDKDGWVVEAVWDPQIPAGAVSVFVSVDGKIQSVMGGM
jgi:hypothetical protein